MNENDGPLEPVWRASLRAERSSGFRRRGVVLLVSVTVRPLRVCAKASAQLTARHTVTSTPGQEGLGWRLVARTPNVEMKQELLDRVVAYLAEHGLGDMSLRPMAAALETSPNRLVHHFGSKQELLVAALARAIQIQVEVRDGWLQRDPSISQADQLRRWWKWLNASPANLSLARLGLEAATLEATHTGLTGDVRADQIGVWRTDIELRLSHEGIPRSQAVTEASLLKALFTGLMVDLMATGDRVRLTRALETGLTRVEAMIAAANYFP